MVKGFLEYMGRYIDLTKDEEEKLSGMLEVRSYDKRVRLTDIGEVEHYLNFVVKGLIRKYFIRGKEQVTKHLATEGHLLASSVSFFTGQPSRYIVETVEPSIVVSLNRSDLEKLLDSGERWETAGMKMMADFLIEKEYWLLDMIRYTPRERFLQFIKEHPDLVQRVPQKYLASYLHIKPETFSRLKHLVPLKNSSLA